jgi:hypothetical protein
VIDPANVPEVLPEEVLSRFVLSRSHFRPSDNTVKPDAFIPSPHVELSLTRHLDATFEEVWTVGKGVAEASHKTLYGRAEIIAAEFTTVGLTVVKAPINGNPNHADAIGWPTEKSAQKLKAIQLAMKSRFQRATVQTAESPLTPPV